VGGCWKVEQRLSAAAAVTVVAVWLAALAAAAAVTVVAVWLAALAARQAACVLLACAYCERDPRAPSLPCVYGP